jgi:hypothetical protein
MTLRDRRCISWYCTRLNVRQWWTTGWNDIWTIAVLYAAFQAAYIWQLIPLLIGAR